MSNLSQEDELDSIKLQLQVIRESAASLLKQMQGMGAQINLDSVLALRMELLLQHLMPDELERAKFELNFEREMEGNLQRMMGEIRKAQLTQGINIKPPINGGLLRG